MADFSKKELAFLARRTIRQAAAHRGTEYGSFLAYRASVLVQELRRQIYQDRLTSLIVRFPTRISFGV